MLPLNAHLSFSILLLIFAPYPFLSAQQIVSGPMAGYAEMLEVPLWVQLDEAGAVQYEYWKESDPATRLRTAPVAAAAKNNYVVTAVADQVEPGQRYRYQLLVDDRPVEQGSGRFQTAPDYRDRMPPPDVTIAVASGLYRNEAAYDPPYRTPGGEYEILTAMAEQDPDMVIWAGNTTHLREADWGSLSGYRKRYGYERALSELQPLLRQTNHVAVWSAADFGPEPADGSWALKDLALQTFDAYWPRRSVAVKGGETLNSQLRWSDVDFFLLDDRTFRQTDGQLESDRKIYAEEQLDWLITALRRSKATFKLVVSGSPVLNPVSDDGLQKVRAERERLLSALTAHQIDGVVFISGGRDYGEVTRMVRSSAPDLYEVSLGPVTARPATTTDELNYFRIPGSVQFKRHFVTVTVTGPESERELVVTFYDKNGTSLWSNRISGAAVR